MTPRRSSATGCAMRSVNDAESVEAVEIVSETPGAALPPIARERIGLQPGQKNVLVRVVLRHPSRTLTRAEANDLRERVYDAINQGSRGSTCRSRGRSDASPAVISYVAPSKGTSTNGLLIAGLGMKVDGPAVDLQGAGPAECHRAFGR